VKGLAFNTLEQLVTRDHGEDAWDDILDRARLDGAYTSLGSYPDEHLMRLVAAASEALDTPPDAVVRWFGREAFPIFAEIEGNLRERHTCTRSLVLTLNDVIHPQVRKLYPGADVPEFDFDSSSEDVLLMGYRSRRRLGRSRSRSPQPSRPPARHSCASRCRTRGSASTPSTPTPSSKPSPRPTCRSRGPTAEPGSGLPHAIGWSACSGVGSGCGPARKGGSIFWFTARLGREPASGEASGRAGVVDGEEGG